MMWEITRFQINIEHAKYIKITTVNKTKLNARQYQTKLNLK